MSVYDFIDAIQGETGFYIREGCVVDSVCANELERKLSREAHLWDKDVFWNIYQGDAKGYLHLSIESRDPWGQNMMVDERPGGYGRHCLSGRFSFPTNPYLSAKTSITEKGQLLLESPNMIADPKAFIEVHTNFSKYFHRVVFQSYHPDDPCIREESKLKARAKAKEWGLPALNSELCTRSSEENEWREYAPSIVLEEYRKIAGSLAVI
ncbi:hypothetical protein HYW75_06045 [Candidatus Pacearchaeota archaeon]|nr:hypothetical protein [Candidatus Pacearchaeota archaeon]